MQQIAAEFGYSETTFVLPPADRANTAHVRIFTPTREIPFAGHPNVGTAFVLASYAAANGETLPEILQFEEAAGLVPVRLLKNNGVVSGAELRVPEPLSCRSEVSPEQVAACLSLEADCISTAVHQPLVASVGLPFLIVALASRDAYAAAYQIYKVSGLFCHWTAQSPFMPIPWTQHRKRTVICRRGCLRRG
jgi:trans-2,3-dihydro-3-hydroxyanthranilate isomerase